MRPVSPGGAPTNTMAVHASRVLNGKAIVVVFAVLLFLAVYTYVDRAQQNREMVSHALQKELDALKKENQHFQVCLRIYILLSFACMQKLTLNILFGIEHPHLIYCWPQVSAHAQGLHIIQ